MKLSSKWNKKPGYLLIDLDWENNGKNYQGFQVQCQDPVTKEWKHPQDIVNMIEQSINKLNAIYEKVNSKVAL